MDIGRILRIKEAIMGVMNALADKSATSGDALPNAYKKFRAEVLSAVDESLQDEVQRLFPEWTRASSAGSVRRGFDPLEASAAAEEARGLLGELAGWLEGLVAEAKLKLEASAYSGGQVPADDDNPT